MTNPGSSPAIPSSPCAPVVPTGPAGPAAQDDPRSAAGFSALGLGPALLSALTALGYEEPTPIQRESIPPLLEGRDLLGQAATGTGKTAAFALPLLQRIAGTAVAPRRPLALVLVPTRELAMQVAQAIHRYGREQHATVLPIYGGQSFSQQLRVLDRGVAVVVATPGRALDHLERGTLSLEDVRTVVLDEADEMLDMGFAEDLEAIMKRLPESRQTALFSATLAPRILSIAERNLRNPVRITIARERAKAGALPRVRQTAYIVTRANKLRALGRVLDMESPTSALVFCRTRLEVDDVTEAMNARGYRAESLHGGHAQEQRDRVMGRFRSNATDLLIATDVAARGLDIDHLSHVINFDVPTEPEAYVHRIGRTGRAGREGVAITFVEPREQRLLRNIQQEMKQRIEVATLPTVADLRHRRLALTKASLREAVLAGRFDLFRTVVAELAAEFDPLDVAAAAVKLAHEASHAEAEASAEEQDAPLDAFPARDPHSGSGRTGSGRTGSGRSGGGARPESGGPSGAGRGTGGGSAEDHWRNPRPRGRENPVDRSGREEGVPRPGGREGPFTRRGGFESTRLFIGAGRFERLRPGDLVGAITNESGLSNDVIGAIEIADRFSLVEVRAEHATAIIKALRGTTLRGRKVVVRRERFER
jgi:ATP-dependent RNA helicase DeaD